jgi:hypothetical protein
VVKIDNWNVGCTVCKRGVFLHLQSPTKAHWSGLVRDSVENLRLHAIFSVLPIIPNIRVLSLHHAEINEAQQANIFGLSTLRTLMVNFCWFHPSTNPIPYSDVTALKLARNDLQTTHYLLKISATTVEALEVDIPTTRRIQPSELIELPKLSTLTINDLSLIPCHTILGTLRRYMSITTLHILVRRGLTNLPLHHSDLPALRGLTCNHRLAVGLIRGRPVTTYVEVHSGWKEGPWRLLAKTRTRISNLKLFIPDNLTDFGYLSPAP